MLGVAGEREDCPRTSFGCPQPSHRPTATEVELFPAVQLFVERVTEVVEDFALTDANAPSVVENLPEA